MCKILTQLGWIDHYWGQSETNFKYSDAVVEVYELPDTNVRFSWKMSIKFDYPKFEFYKLWVDSRAIKN